MADIPNDYGERLLRTEPKRKMPISAINNSMLTPSITLSSTQSSRTRNDSLGRLESGSIQSMLNQHHPPVFINVYELETMKRCTRRSLECMGLGAYHTAIQIGKIEYTFGGNTESDRSGIYSTMARKNRSFNFRYAIPVINKQNPAAAVLTMSESHICN